MHSKIISLHEKENHTTATIQDILHPDDLAFLEECFAAHTRRGLSRGHKVPSIQDIQQRVRELILHSRKTPWAWNEDDFTQWCEHLGQEKRLARSSQRKYQSAIRGFLDYLVASPTIREQILKRYHVRIHQICTRDNCIPHVHENEQEALRLPFSVAEIDRLFEVNSASIEEAYMFGAKSLPLERDRTMLALTYTCGLRASEVINIDLCHLSKDFRRPESGDYGRVSVKGKGSNGSGFKPRDISITSASTSQLLKLYTQHIRPKLLVNGDPNEQALFISERGSRLSYSGFTTGFVWPCSLQTLPPTDALYILYATALPRIMPKPGHLWSKSSGCSIMRCSQLPSRTHTLMTFMSTTNTNMLLFTCSKSRRLPCHNITSIGGSMT